MRHRGNTGVTLLELLCVIAIIAILMAILLGPIFKAYKRARALTSEESTR